MHQVSWRRVIAVAVIAGVALIAPRTAQAQAGKLSGVVTDAQSGQPIEGVQVRVLGTGFGAQTQTNGRFFIISVPPGTYTLQARRIGYASSEVSNVAVRIDVTREVNFSLSSAATQLTTTRVIAEAAPLIEQGVTGSRTAVSADIIDALPVTSVSGVLALQQGFLETPQNTDIVSFNESRRNAATPVRIRGGRGGETTTLIDGIPINNIVFGGPAFDITTSAVQQLDFQRGGFEPQYGNALSGIINIATREGGPALDGNVEWQTTGLGASLGQRQDELAGFNLFRGFLSGPVPGTSDKVRFMVAGQMQQGRDRVLQFDNQTASYSRVGANTLNNAPNPLDLIPGFRGFGYDSQRDVIAKLTLLPTNSTKLNVGVIDYQRQRLPFDLDYAYSGFNVFGAEGVKTLEDSIGVLGSERFGSIVQGSIRADRRLYTANLEQRFGRSNAILRVARFEQERQTCNYFQGVCLATRFGDLNFNEQFQAPGVTGGIPFAGTDTFFGGEKAKSYIVRGDVESQVTDHHNLQGGVFYQQHDIKFNESINVGTNGVSIINGAYGAKPYDAAAYLQDKIEYDFLTVKLGFRYDYGIAKGSSFRDPQDPNNGTTIRDICNGTAPTLGATTPITFTDPRTGVLQSGIAACNVAKNTPGSENIFSDAVARAQQDDFAAASARVAFSPRIAVNFPLSERSSLFFNFGQYAQNPLYNNLYQNTGVGTTSGAQAGVCPEGNVKPGTTECYPVFFSTQGPVGYLGNPNLLLERTTSYEVGYQAELGSAYALVTTVYSKDQSGLSGIQRARQNLNDPGTTYGTGTPRYSVVVNQDYGTTRGIEVQFLKRLTNYWGYNINYAFSKATTNSPPPDLRAQTTEQGDPTERREITSEIDQPHVANASVYFRVGTRAPDVRFGTFLRNSYLTVTTRAASGLPYTPTLTFGGFGNNGQLAINSGRGPTTLSSDLLVGKDFIASGLRYGAFARVSNLFDRRNCLQVFPTTGRCDSGTIDQSRRRTGNSLGDGASSTFFDRASYYGARRTIYAGVKVDF